MKKKYNIEHSIRGDFYAIELTKRYKGMPGFAPEYHDTVIGRVVVKFRDEKPYFQTSSNTYMVLDIKDMNQIARLLKVGYRESDWKGQL